MKAFVYLLPAFFVFSCNNSGDAGKSDQDSLPTSTDAVVNQSSMDSSLTLLVGDYLELKDAMVEADTSLVNQRAGKLLSRIDSLYTGLDSANSEPANKLISNLAAESRGLLGEDDLTAKRREFSMISDNLKDLLNLVAYKGPKLYEQTCPMAFDENEEARWLSKSSEIVNPYMGKKHSKYSSGMLHCGSVTDSIMFR